MRTVLKTQLQTHSIPQILCVGVMVALLIRWGLLYEESKDYVRHLEPWYDFIAANGGLAALKSDFSDYAPSYQYWLVFASSGLAALPKVIAIKLPSLVGDFICAFFVYRLVQLKYPQGKQPVAAFVTVLLTPTVFINSAFWGQCDSLYTSGLLACVYFLCLQQSAWAFISLGIAFAIKQQTVFLIPALGILALKERLSWSGFLWVPAVYVALALPAWVAGRPFQSLMLVYFNQANQYHRLSANAPSIFALFPFHQPLYYFWFGLGLLLTLGAIAGVTRCVLKSNSPITSAQIIALAFLSVLMVPYFLPKMHDRYFYPADVLAIPFGFYFPQYYWVAVVVEVISLFSYIPRLWVVEPLPLIFWTSLGLALPLGVITYVPVQTLKIRMKLTPVALTSGCLALLLLLLRWQNIGALFFFVLSLALGCTVLFMLKQCRFLFHRPVA
jgi:Gpi18-like mannosyltransferase